MTVRLEIINYFDTLINDVDLKAETLLTEMGEQYHEHINLKRTSFIDQIEQVKAYNLSNLADESDKTTSKDELFKRYCFFLDMDKLNGHRFISQEKENAHDRRLDNMSVEQFFREMVDRHFGVLIVLDGYLSDAKMSLYTELLHFHECYFPYETYHTDQIEIDISDSDYVRNWSRKTDHNYYPFQPNEKSNIFSSKKHYLNNLYWSIWLQYDIFKHVNGFIIQTNKRDLFKLNYLQFYDVTVDCINDQELELFGGDISLFYYTNLANVKKYTNFLIFAKILQAQLTNVKSVHLTVDDKVRADLTKLKDINNLHCIKIFASVVNRGTTVDLQTDKTFNLADLAHLESVNIFSSPSACLKMNNYKLDQLNSLTELCLSNFQSGNLNSDQFMCLINLKKLKLDSNSIVSISSRTFSHLINLNELNLSSNQIETIESDAFYGLDNLKHLDLCKNKLTSVQFLDHTENLIDLKLSHNLLTQLVSGAFKRLPNLERLQLAFNSIDRIDDGVFCALNKLSDLDLSSNKFEFVRARWFNDAINLSHLDLSRNELESVEFDRMPGLKYLNLSSNKRLVLSPESTFDKLANLEELDVSFCSIKCLNQLHLAGLINLKKLNLQTNKIGHSLAASDAFVRLTNLTHINLSYNKVYDNLRVIWTTFDSIYSLLGGLVNLIDVDLSSSFNFEHLPAGLFNGLPKLERLSMSSNKIQRLDERAFEGLANLRYLCLSDNDINVIPNNTFDGLRNLTELHLDRNQIERLDFLNTPSLMNLKQVPLYMNKIARIDSSSFRFLYTLVELNLESNLINEIDVDSFECLHAVREVNLCDNPIENIDCIIFAPLKSLKFLRIENKNTNAHILKGLKNFQRLYEYDIF